MTAAKLISVADCRTWQMLRNEVGYLLCILSFQICFDPLYPLPAAPLSANTTEFSVGPAEKKHSLKKNLFFSLAAQDRKDILNFCFVGWCISVRMQRIKWLLAKTQAILFFLLYIWKMEDVRCDCIKLKGI